MGHHAEEHTHTLSASDERKAMVSVAHSHLASGKRHLFLREFPEAADDLAKACDLLATRFGELADEVATPYLYYGKALLEMGRIENGILGNAVKQGAALSDGKDDIETTDEISTSNCGIIIEEDEKEMDQNERKKLRREVEDAMGPNNIYEKRMREMCLGAKEHGNEVDNETEDEGLSQDEASQDEESQNEGDGAEPMEDKPTDDDKHVHTCDSTPEEESNLEHAWKILEIAVIIFKRMGDVASLKLAEAKITLAHVSMETENYETAAGDFQAALELQKKFLKMDDRRVAETLYHIGLAHSFNNNFPAAVAWYQQSRDTLQLCIGNLEEDIRVRAAEEYGEVHKSDEIEDMEAELRELKDLVVLDMNNKIEDVQNSMKFYFASNASKQQPNANGGFDAPSGSFDQVNQVVAKKAAEKRKSETDESNDLKKAHLNHDMDQVMEVSRPCEAQG